MITGGSGMYLETALSPQLSKCSRYFIPREKIKIPPTYRNQNRVMTSILFGFLAQSYHLKTSYLTPRTPSTNRHRTVVSENPAGGGPPRLAVHRTYSLAHASIRAKPNEPKERPPPPLARISSQCALFPTERWRGENLETNEAVKKGKPVGLVHAVEMR